MTIPAAIILGIGGALTMNGLLNSNGGRLLSGLAFITLGFSI